MDIKRMAAIQIMESVPGAQMLNDRCPDCTAPLLIFPKQNMPFCGYCVAKRIRAADDRELLERIKHLDLLSNPIPDLTIKTHLKPGTINWSPYLKRKGVK